MGIAMKARCVMPATLRRADEHPMNAALHLLFMNGRAPLGHARARDRGRAADGEPDPPRPARGRAGRRRCAERRGRALDGRGSRVRRDRARRDAPRDQRLRDVQPPARERRLGAGADAHRARRRRGSRRGARQRRGRLPRQAVRLRGAAGAAAGAHAPWQRRAPERPGGRRPDARPGHEAGAARQRGDRALGQGVRAARDVHAPPGRGALAAAPARARLGLRLRCALQRRRRLHPPPAEEDRRAVRAPLARDGSGSGIPAAGRGVSGVPIRLRVTTAFAVVMALELAASGWFLYARLSSHLATQLRQELQVRAQDLSALVRGGGSLASDARSRLVEHGESYAQLVDRRGVVDATPPLGGKPVLSPAQLAAAAHEPQYVGLGPVPGLNEPSRVLATPVERAGRPLVLIVGGTRENDVETLASFRNELLIAGPIALLLASLAGYLVAGVALRPVEAMRRRAAEISAETPGERLPVPTTHDEVERLGTTLNEMLERLEDALRRERDFVADAGHELRTPLALLRTELELALRHGVSQDDLREAIAVSALEVDRLAQLAEDLLLIARSERGELPLRLETLDAEAVLADVA